VYGTCGEYGIYLHQFLQRVSLLPNQRLDVNITSIAAGTCKYRAGKVSPSETSRLSAPRVRLSVRSRFDDLVRLICQRFAPTRCPSLYPGWTDGVGRRGISRKLEIYPRHSTRPGADMAANRRRRGSCIIRNEYVSDAFFSRGYRLSQKWRVTMTRNRTCSSSSYE